MSPLSQQQRAELLDSILQVAMGCPVDQTNPADCPLFLIRKMDLPRRIQWLSNLTDEDLTYLASYHCLCLKIKLESRLPELCAST
jgi:hypothetical protein